MAERKAVDWDLVERDWRAGIKSKQQMSTEYGVSRQAMDKHFAKRGITRYLADKIRDKATSLVERSIVPAEPLSPATEREIVDANAALQSDIILTHRKDIQRTRKLSMQLLGELEAQTDSRDLIEELSDLLRNPDDKAMMRRLELLERMMSLGTRAGTMKTLTETLRTLVSMERQAFGLDEKADDEGGDGAVDDIIKRVQERNGR
jgi:hypothetical protein